MKLLKCILVSGIVFLLILNVLLSITIMRRVDAYIELTSVQRCENECKTDKSSDDIRRRVEESTEIYEFTK